MSKSASLRPMNQMTPVTLKRNAAVAKRERRRRRPRRRLPKRLPSHPRVTMSPKLPLKPRRRKRTTQMKERSPFIRQKISRGKEVSVRPQACKMLRPNLSKLLLHNSNNQLLRLSNQLNQHQLWSTTLDPFSSWVLQHLRPSLPSLNNQPVVAGAMTGQLDLTVLLRILLSQFSNPCNNKLFSNLSNNLLSSRCNNSSSRLNNSSQCSSQLPSNRPLHLQLICSEASLTPLQFPLSKQLLRSLRDSNRTWRVSSPK